MTSPERVAIVPHGIRDLPLVDPDDLKPSSASKGRLVILSFGLLGPGKGNETVIAAMPAVVPRHPDSALHGPGRDASEPPAPRGRGLRGRLAGRWPKTLGVADNILFVDRFVDDQEFGDVARGGRRLRHALPQPRPDRVGYLVLRDGGRQGGRLDPVLRTPARSWPETAGGSCAGSTGGTRRRSSICFDEPGRGKPWQAVRTLRPWHDLVRGRPQYLRVFAEARGRRASRAMRRTVRQLA